MRKIERSNSLKWALFGYAAIVMVAPAHAQSETRSGAGSDGEIVVTAQKREQKLQDIGISISALGKNDLAAMGRQDVTALVGRVPGVQITQYSPTVTIFNIRGVSQNDFADSQEAPIAFYNDEVYISAMGAISGQNFDLERVEVLRGPQGTLFGRNATGGLIQAITAKPTRELDGFVTLTGATQSQFATEGAIGGPLSDDVRARLSFTSDHRKGYLKNSLGRDLGGAKFWAGRFQIAADVAGGELTVKAQLLRNDHDSGAGAYTNLVSAYNDDLLGRFVGPDEDFYGTCPGCNPFGYKPPSNPRRTEQNHPADFNRTYWSATARYVKDFGGVTLTSISDYQKLKKDYTEDTDISPLDIFNYTTRQRLYQYSQELRLSNNGDRLNWVVGAYGIRIHTRNGYTVDLPLFEVRSDYGGLLNTKSIAFFGQAEYKLTDQFTLIGGLRYSYDRKTLDYAIAETGTGNPVFEFNRSLYPNLARQSFENYSGKIEVDYHISPGNMIYLSVNRGTKSGGFGTPGFIPFPPEDIPFDQEVLTNFEGGIKLTAFDRTTHFNLSAFHYKYHDYQAFEMIGTTQLIVNKPARINGLEFSFDTRPVEGLSLSGFAAYLDTKIRGILLPGGRVADRKMPQAPKYSLGGQVSYRFALGSGTAQISTDWKYNSSNYFATYNAPVDLEKHYAVGNVRVSYTLAGGHWEAAAFVNNVTDKLYRLYDTDLTNPVANAQAVYARPRWGGGSLTYRIR